VLLLRCLGVCPTGDSGGWKEPAYTDPIEVDAACDDCDGRYLAFVFHNNAHNVQLLLPITVTIDVVPWGFPFLAIFVVALIGYVAGGLVYARQVQNSTTVGMMAHPHARQWQEVLSLVVDGTSFVGSQGRSKGASSSRRREGKGGGGSGGGGAASASFELLLSHFDTKNEDQFTKTGSGQT
jgi:hypothetical protein